MSVKCLSSHLTTELMTFRNPLGKEENWLHAPNGGIPNDPYYIPRVITTQMGASFLIATSTIESIAYCTLFVCSIPVAIVTTRPCKFAATLLSSSTFTLYWNIGNTLIFNFWCTNLFTEESFARYSMDHWPRGRALRIAVVAIEIGIIALTIFMRNSNQYQPVAFPFISEAVSKPWLRPEDILFIANWINQHQIPVNFGVVQAAPGNVAQNQLGAMVGGVNQSVKKGAEFFKKCIFDATDLDKEIKEKVIEYDSEVYIFVLTRCFYWYAFGDYKNEELPSFFKPKSKELLNNIRQTYSAQTGLQLASRMKNLKAFDEEFSVQKQHLKKIFDLLRNVAYEEVQSSIFATNCWEKACQMYEKEKAQAAG